MKSQVTGELERIAAVVPAQDGLAVDPIDPIDPPLHAPPDGGWRIGSRPTYVGRMEMSGYRTGIP
ncbi:hypothetical protein GTZ89_21895 [Streptomyces sp. SID8382]|uniref:hypothetical protein n=1 Tax=Streptomyces TaxID=1883 RepID=UPI0013318AF9|nr:MULTISPECIES: hypothetical protein [unclassified Streptomyces]MCD9591612.1 hypothetical protein [Streptomyces sp. 8ZJF_21]MYX58240.1 hypothetical protein [Streptomyces sp. SID8382]